MIKPAVFMACLALAASCAGTARADEDDDQCDTCSFLVTTQTPQRGTLPRIVVGYGTAEAAPNGATTISALHAGVVLQLDTRPGRSVHKGDLLLQFGAAPSAVSSWQQAVSAVAVARRARAHTALLASEQLATKLQLAQADKDLSDAEAALGALREGGGADKVQAIIAPFDGVVTNVAVAQGDRVQPDGPLLTVASDAGQSVTVGIEPSDRIQVKPDQAVKLEPLSGDAAAVTGTVRSVTAMLDPKTRLVDVQIAVPPGAVLSGEAYKATITAGTAEGWLVPRQAVLDNHGPQVYQVAGGKAVSVGVKILATDGDKSLVQGSINPKRGLVTRGNYELDSGVPVREDGKGS